MNKKTFPHRLGLQQRVLPSYRVPFFDLLAGCCDGMGLYAGQPRAVEMIQSGKPQVAALYPAKNIHLLSGGLYACLQWDLLHWLHTWDPEALIVEANPRNLLTNAAVRWMHARGRKVIGWGLGAPNRPRIPGAAGFWQRFILQFDAMLAYSQRGAQDYARLGFPGEKIFVAHNSVSAAPTQSPRPRPPSADPATLLFVGRLQARKRVDHLLRACASLEPTPRLIVVGEGPARQELETLARQIFPSAEFAGARHGQELEPYFARADLFVLPGTGGLAVQQAMSYGLPVIVAQGDGTQDDLVRAGNGWQIPPEDQAALTRTLKDALTDIPRLRRMGDESFRIIVGEVNIQKMAGVFVDALNSLY